MQSNLVAHIVDVIGKRLEHSLADQPFEVNSCEAVYKQTKSILKKWPGVDEGQLILRAEQQGDTVFLKFGNLYTALLCRGILIPPGLSEYTDTVGTQFRLSNDGTLEVRPVKVMERIEIKVIINKEGSCVLSR